MSNVNIIVQVYANTAAIGTSVMAMIFLLLFIPRASRDRTVPWGILTAITLREFIGSVGSTLVARYEWVLVLLFAGFLGVNTLIVDVGPIWLLIFIGRTNKA